MDTLNKNGALSNTVVLWQIITSIFATSTNIYLDRTHLTTPKKLTTSAIHNLSKHCKLLQHHATNNSNIWIVYMIILRYLKYY